MFNCDGCGRPSRPGEKMTKVITERHTNGNIAREAKLCTECSAVTAFEIDPAVKKQREIASQFKPRLVRWDKAKRPINSRLTTAG